MASLFIPNPRFLGSFYIPMHCITAQALQKLQFAAEKSGVSVDALNDAIKELQVRAFDAKSGEGEAAEAFQTLGVKATDAAWRIREPLELLDEVADKFLQLPTHSDRLWVADAMFGDEGATKDLQGYDACVRKRGH